MYMDNFVRPVQLQCNQCGTTGVVPKIRKIDAGKDVIEEAVWSCHRCGTYFKRGTVSRTPKKSN